MGPTTPRLAGGYSATLRRVETAILIAYGLLQAHLLHRLADAPWTRTDRLGIPAGVILGALLADLTSALVHWGFDTWGSVRTPVIGRSFVRTFREHHTDAREITRHGFVETNGANALLTLFVLIPTALARPDVGAPLGRATIVAVLSLTLLIGVTSQIHKWAHTEAPPPLVRWLQRAGVILSPEHHAAHHAAPHDRCYAITFGYVDALLDRGLFRALERVVTAATGLRPRAEE